MGKPAAVLALIAMCAPFVVLGLIQAWNDSPTWDEGIYIAAGVTTLTRHQVRIDIEHPPLAKVLDAAPALFAHPIVPDTPAFRLGREFDYGGQFVEANRAAGRLRRVVFLARLVPLACAVAVGLMLYLIASMLFGRAAGLVAAGLWLLNPFFLGLGHVGNVDVPATLTTVVGAWLLIRLLRRPGWGACVLLGSGLGVALLVRSTGLLLAPIIAIGAAIAMRDGPRHTRSSLWRSFGAAALVLVVGWLCVWGGMRGLSPHPWAPPAASAQEVVIANPAHSVPWTARVADWVPWPREYADGIRYLAVVSTPPGPGFLLGHAWDGGRWWYWPGAMLVKLPLTTLLALVIGLVVAGRRFRSSELALAVLFPAVLLTGFVVLQPRDQGLRYLAPVLALLFIAAAPLASVLRAVWTRLLIAAAVVLQLGFLVGSSPHSLAWTAPPFGPAYRVEADANLDWNQDFYRLQSWAAGKHPWVAYFGLPSLHLDAVPGARELLGASPATVQGWVAVFGSILTTYNRGELSWVRAYCPVGTIGGSILLYYFDKPPDARPGPVTPVRECPGGVSHRVPA